MLAQLLSYLGRNPTPDLTSGLYTIESVSSCNWATLLSDEDRADLFAGTDDGEHVAGSEKVSAQFDYAHHITVTPVNSGTHHLVGHQETPQRLVHSPKPALSYIRFVQPDRQCGRQGDGA
jgi:hypothetical protein